MLCVPGQEQYPDSSEDLADTFAIFFGENWEIQNKIGQSQCWTYHISKNAIER